MVQVGVIGQGEEDGDADPFPIRKFDDGQAAMAQIDHPAQLRIGNPQHMA